MEEPREKNVRERSSTRNGSLSGVPHNESRERCDGTGGYKYICDDSQADLSLFSLQNFYRL